MGLAILSHQAIANVSGSTQTSGKGNDRMLEAAFARWRVRCMDQLIACPIALSRMTAAGTGKSSVRTATLWLVAVLRVPSKHGLRPWPQPLEFMALRRRSKDDDSIGIRH